MYKNVQRKFLPIVWFEQHFKIDPSLAFYVRLLLFVPLLGQIVGFIIAFFGIYLIYKTITIKNNDLASNHNIQEDNTITKRLPENLPLIK